MVKQINFALRIDDDIFKDIKKESSKIGLSMNKIINMKLKGMKIINDK